MSKNEPIGVMNLRWSSTGVVVGSALVERTDDGLTLHVDIDPDSTPMRGGEAG